MEKLECKNAKNIWSVNLTFNISQFTRQSCHLCCAHLTVTEGKVLPVNTSSIYVKLHIRHPWPTENDHLTL